MTKGEILRVHADTDGNVWCGQDSVRAFRTDLAPDEFVGRRVFRDAERIRVLGVPGNAALIVAMFAARKKGWGVVRKQRRYEVGSPHICYTKTDDPEFVLQQLRQADTPALTVGSWHELTEQDYNTYLLVRTMLEAGGSFNDMARNVFKYHCAWPAMTFLPTMNVEAACRLVCEIVDPRWYNHSSRPGRVTRLLSFLGLTPRNVEALNGLIHPSRSAQCRNWARAELVLDAWSKTDKPVDLNDPRNFLWRIHSQCGGGTRGLLKASRVFVQYVRLVWLQAMARPGREVFVPAYFFKRPDEAKAFLMHVVRDKPV